MTSLILNTANRINTSDDPCSSNILLRRASFASGTANPTPSHSSFTVEKIIIPFSWYNVSLSNYNIAMTDVSQYLVHQSQGSYNISDYISMLQTKLHSDDPQGSTYTVTNNFNTAKFTVTSNSTFKMRMSSDPLANAQYLTGFTSDSSVNVSSYTAENCYDLQRTMYIKLNIGASMPYTDMNFSNSTTIVIPVSQYNYGDVIVYEPEKKDYFVTIPANNIVNLSVYDEQNNLLTMNGRDYAVVLRKTG